MPIGFALVALGVLGLMGFVYATKPARDKLSRDIATATAAAAARDACLALQDEITAMRGQGADLNAIAAMEARLASCAKRTGAISSWEALLSPARDKRRMIELEWSNYRSTDWADTLKRGSTLGTIWRLSDDYMVNIRDALAAAKDSAEGSRAIVEELEIFWPAADVRAICHATPGMCGNGDPDRALEEFKRAVAPVTGSAYVVERHGAFLDSLGSRADGVRALGPGLLDVAREQARPRTLVSGAAGLRGLRAAPVSSSIADVLRKAVIR